MNGTASGSWALADHDDLFVLRCDDGLWEAWAPADSDARRMLESHGLADETFPTRRDALQALAAVLGLERESCASATARGLEHLLVS